MTKGDDVANHCSLGTEFSRQRTRLVQDRRDRVLGAQSFPPENSRPLHNGLDYSGGVHLHARHEPEGLPAARERTDRIGSAAAANDRPRSCIPRDREERQRDPIADVYGDRHSLPKRFAARHLLEYPRGSTQQGGAVAAVLRAGRRHERLLGCPYRDQRGHERGCRNVRRLSPLCVDARRGGRSRQRQR